MDKHTHKHILIYKYIDVCVYIHEADTYTSKHTHLYVMSCRAIVLYVYVSKSLQIIFENLS